MPAIAWKEPAAHLAQALWPSLPVNVPGAQIVRFVAPCGQADPAGHVVQSACDWPPVELRKLPALQAVGALAPAAQTEPAGQLTQAVSPLLD